MDRKSIGLKILFCTEIIIAIRVLLFSLPVMINKISASNLTMSNANDGFIVVMTVIASLYLIVGILSLLGNRLWKTLHFLAVVVALVVTVGSLRGIDPSLASTGTYYFSPAFLSVIFVVIAVVLGRAKQTV